MKYVVYFVLVCFLTACDLDVREPDGSTETEEIEAPVFEEPSADDSSSTGEEPSPEPSEAETSEEPDDSEPDDPETEVPETSEGPETSEDPDTSEDPTGEDCGLHELGCGDSSPDPTEKLDPKQCFDECHDSDAFDTKFAECGVEPSLCGLGKCRARVLAARNESHSECGAECETISGETIAWYHCKSWCGNILARCDCVREQIEASCMDDSEVCLDLCDEELRGRRPADEA